VGSQWLQRIPVVSSLGAAIRTTTVTESASTGLWFLALGYLILSLLFFGLFFLSLLRCFFCTLVGNFLLALSHSSHFVPMAVVCTILSLLSRVDRRRRRRRRQHVTLWRSASCSKVIDDGQKNCDSHRIVLEVIGGCIDGAIHHRCCKFDSFHRDRPIWGFVV